MPFVPKSVTDDPSFLSAALEGLELQRGRIEEQIATVKSLLGGKSVGRPPAAAAVVVAKSEAGASAPRKKRTLSAAARKRIAEAQKKRWAEFRKKA